MAQCMTPYITKERDILTGEQISVPCGKCPNCVKRRVSEWSFRLMQEEKVSISAQFVTLTYETKTVPITNSGYMSLDKRDTQLFFKKLRKDSENKNNKITYYICGEYGSATFRPHYHAIIFNATPASVGRCWSNGSVHYGTVTGASIGYTLKYISKRGKIPQHAKDDREPEFANMSKGIGKSYITEKMTQWHLNNQVINERMYVNIEDGKKISMPRYMKDRIYSKEQRKVIGSKSKIKMEEELLKNMEKENYSRNKFESDKQAFKKMDKDAKKGDKI